MCRKSWWVLRSELDEVREVSEGQTRRGKWDFADGFWASKEHRQVRLLLGQSRERRKRGEESANRKRAAKDNKGRETKAKSYLSREQS